MRRVPNHFKKDGNRIELLYNVDGQRVAPTVGIVFALLYALLAAIAPRPTGPGTWLYLGAFLTIFAGLTALLSWQACRKIVITQETVRWHRGSCPREAVRVIFRVDYHGRSLPAVLGLLGCTEEELTRLGQALAAENRQVTRCGEKFFRRLRTEGRINRELYRSLPYLTERLGGEKVPYPMCYFEYSKEREQLLREKFPEAACIHLQCI